MKLVCLDTQVLIWGVKGQATSGQEEMIRKAGSLIEHLDRTGVDVMISSVTVGEFLMPIPKEEHQSVIDILSKRFMVVTYDLKAASVFAQLWQEKSNAGDLDELKDQGNTREKLKADSQIVATAIANGADLIYSNDQGVGKFAAGHIRVAEVIGVASQLEIDELLPGNAAP